MTELADFIDDSTLDRLVQAAIEEDLGPDRRDLTSALTVPADVSASAGLHARGTGVACGLALLPRIAAAFNTDLHATLLIKDGQAVQPRQKMAQIVGDLRAILALERTALNFICHLSGVATLTVRYVAAVAGAKAKIYDTRKTLPGLRSLQKYAVACGGGHTHRIGLYDAMLIKDNHLARLSLDELAATVTAAAEHARKKYENLKFVEVEVDTLDQLERLLTTPIDIILLDNMRPEALRKAVRLRDKLAPNIELEASGGINLDNVRAIAQTGVDRIAVGALTHSAPALDIGLDIDPRDPNGG